MSTARRGKRERPEVQRFEYDLEGRLWDIKRELEAETYGWGGYRAVWTNPSAPGILMACVFGSGRGDSGAPSSG